MTDLNSEQLNGPVPVHTIHGAMARHAIELVSGGDRGRMTNNPDHYTRGTIVGGNAEADRMDLIRDREWGTITSQYPKHQMVTVRWHGTGKFERWHVDLLEIIDHKLRK